MPTAPPKSLRLDGSSTMAGHLDFGTYRGVSLADPVDDQDAATKAYVASVVAGLTGLQSSDIDTLAELNAILSDATLVTTTDSRLSDARTPTAHTHPANDVTAGTFPAAISGQTPTLSTHLTTKAYVDVAIADLTSDINTNAGDIATLSAYYSQISGVISDAPTTYVASSASGYSDGDRVWVDGDIYEVTSGPITDDTSAAAAISAGNLVIVYGDVLDSDVRLVPVYSTIDSLPDPSSSSSPNAVQFLGDIGGTAVSDTLTRANSRWHGTITVDGGDSDPLVWVRHENRSCRPYSGSTRTVYMPIRRMSTDAVYDSGGGTMVARWPLGIVTVADIAPESGDYDPTITLDDDSTMLAGVYMGVTNSTTQEYADAFVEIGTVATDGSDFNLTWDSGSSNTGLVVDVDNTAGGSGDLLDLQVDGSSKASVSSAGVLSLASGIYLSGGTRPISVNSSFFQFSGGGGIAGLGCPPNPYLRLDENYLYEISNGVWEFRNGSTPQTILVCGDYTGSTDKEATEISHDGLYAYAVAYAASPGIVRPMILGSTAGAILRTSASVTPPENLDVAVELTNNTTLTLKAKGSDGTVRSGTIAIS